MPELDHLIVPSRDRRSSARFLAELLGVRWEEDTFGIFSPVYVNDRLTIDFGDADRFDIHHYCFKVTDEEFDAIHARLVERSIPYRSTPHGPMDMKVSTAWGGRNLYWEDADGHYWEMLTVSYPRSG